MQLLCCHIIIGSLIPLLLFMTYYYAFCARRQKAVTVDPMVFACVAMMSRAIGPKISKEVKDLLEPMLSVGLRWVIHAICIFIHSDQKNQYIEVHRKWPSTWNNNDYFSLSFVFAVQPLQLVYMIWLVKCLNLRRILKVKFNACIIITQPLCEGLNIQLDR